MREQQAYRQNPTPAPNNYNKPQHNYNALPRTIISQQTSEGITKTRYSDGASSTRYTIPIHRVNTIDESYEETQQPQNNGGHNPDYSVDQLLFMLKNKAGIAAPAGETNHNLNAILVKEPSDPKPMNDTINNITPKVALTSWEKPGSNKKQPSSAPKTLSTILAICTILAISGHAA
jgi:hypothetical protein